MTTPSTWINKIGDDMNHEPVIVHQGRYRLYEKPDGGFHIVYQRDDTDTPDHFELPGAMVNLAKMAGEGKLSIADMFREVMKLRGTVLSVSRETWTSYRCR
jgi:hypothetical protein